MKKHYRKENDCLNCGTILEGKFCHNCGQENLQMKESFGHMLNHAVSDYFHFDDQFFHTMRPLFLKPGFLTNQYMSGHRAGYLHPVKMYIFISLVYFLLVFQSGQKIIQVNGKNVQATQQQIDSVANDPGTSAEDKKALVKLKKYTPIIDSDFSFVKVNVKDDKKSAHFLSPTTNDTTYDAYIAAQQKLPENKRDSFFERLYNKKTFAYKAEYGDRTKEVILEQFEHNMPKMMFILLPLCALILMVAFWDKTKYYVEYLIYSLHLHCFLFLFLSIIIILKWIVPVPLIDSWLDFFAFIAIVWYIYKSLREVFHRSRFRTITKMIGAYIMYLVSFVICVSLVFFITAMLM